MTVTSSPIAHPQDAKPRRAWVAGGAGFVWTETRRQALELGWQDAVNDAEIAREWGICRRTLGNWKRSAAFQAEITRRADAYVRLETRRMQR